jgi:hypothetical protein
VNDVGAFLADQETQGHQRAKVQEPPPPEDLDADPCGAKVLAPGRGLPQDAQAHVAARQTGGEEGEQPRRAGVIEARGDEEDFAHGSFILEGGFW